MEKTHSFVVFTEDGSEEIFRIGMSWDQIQAIEIAFDENDPVLFGPPDGCEFYGTLQEALVFLAKCIDL